LSQGKHKRRSIASGDNGLPLIQDTLDGAELKSLHTSAIFQSYITMTSTDLRRMMNDERRRFLLLFTSMFGRARSVAWNGIWVILFSLSHCKYIGCPATCEHLLEY
jgi:hypothetical protein